MTKLSSLQPSSHHRALIYGPPKSGKTLLAGRLAEKFNLIWFDLENGHETLFQLPQDQQDRIELIVLPDTRSFPIAIETCKKVVKATLPISICKKHGKVACQLCKKADSPVYIFDPTKLTGEDVVVFDSATQLTASAISHLTKDEPEDYKLTFNDYGNLGRQLDIFFSHIQQAKYNVVVISHEIDANLEEKGKTSLVPVAGTRNFSRNVAKYFDHVIYAKRENKKHVFASGSTYSNTILTGSRTDVAIENETVASLRPIFLPSTKATTTANISEASQAKKILSGLSVKEGK